MKATGAITMKCRRPDIKTDSRNQSRAVVLGCVFQAMFWLRPACHGRDGSGVSCPLQRTRIEGVCEALVAR